MSDLMAFSLRLRHFLAEGVKKTGRERFAVQLHCTLGLDPCFRISFLFVQRKRPFPPTAGIIGVYLQTVGEAIIRDHEMLRAVELFIRRQPRPVARMHRPQIRQQSHSLLWIIDQLSLCFKLFNSLGQFSWLAQRRSEPPKGLVVFRVKQPRFVESSHGGVQHILSDTRPSLLRQSATCSLPVAESKGRVSNEVLVDFLAVMRWSCSRLAIHR